MFLLAFVLGCATYFGEAARIQSLSPRLQRDSRAQLSERTSLLHDGEQISSHLKSRPRHPEKLSKLLTLLLVAGPPRYRVGSIRHTPRWPPVLMSHDGNGDELDDGDLVGNATSFGDLVPMGKVLPWEVVPMGNVSHGNVVPMDKAFHGKVMPTGRKATVLQGVGMVVPSGRSEIDKMRTKLESQFAVQSLKLLDSAGRAALLDKWAGQTAAYQESDQLDNQELADIHSRQLQGIAMLRRWHDQQFLLAYCTRNGEVLSLAGGDVIGENEGRPLLRIMHILVAPSQIEKYGRKLQNQMVSALHSVGMKLKVGVDLSIARQHGEA